MNFAKNFKWQLVVAALGFSLVLIPRANSQEIVNTDFSTPSTSVSGNFNTAAPADMNTTAAVTQSVYTPANAISSRANNQMQQMNAVNMPRETEWFAGLALLLIACAILRKVTSNRHGNVNSTWNPPPVRAN
ncbi:MAG TPA: hypothetical protein VKB48_10780 [Candidatus Acidoferrum sp.]|nr:hypothetical protein [Candidatus Acidoferrum sp.]